MSREVLDFLGDEEIEGARNLMLQMTNRMASSMCPDIFSDKILACQVEVVSSVTLLDQKLPGFLMDVKKASGLFSTFWGKVIGVGQNS